jgi:hypothetical protein
VYGARKTWKELKRGEGEVGRDQVARVMRKHRLVGKLRGSKKLAARMSSTRCAHCIDSSETWPSGRCD